MASTRSVPCRFFQVGRCTQGEACRFSHELVRQGERARSNVPCKFFAAGHCANANCPFAHGGRAREPSAPPPDAHAAQRQALVPKPSAPRAVAPAPRPDALGPPPPPRPAGAPAPEGEGVCAVCLEDVAASGRLFGLLPSCSHCVCLACIREWRTSGSVETSAARGCPVCRVVSPFVVPSRAFATGAAKGAVRDAYLRTLGATPCKYYDRGRGTCPFGSSCFYLHAAPDGTRIEPEPPRFAYGASAPGAPSAVGVRAPTLSDFVATPSSAAPARSAGGGGARARGRAPGGEGAAFDADDLLDALPTFDHRAPAADARDYASGSRQRHHHHQ